MSLTLRHSRAVVKRPNYCVWSDSDDEEKPVGPTKEPRTVTGMVRCDHCAHVAQTEGHLLHHHKWLHWAVLGKVRARDR